MSGTVSRRKWLRTGAATAAGAAGLAVAVKIADRYGLIRLTAAEFGDRA